MKEFLIIRDPVGGEALQRSSLVHFFLFFFLFCMVFCKVYRISLNNKKSDNSHTKKNSFNTCASSPWVKPKQTADMFLLCLLFFLISILCSVICPLHRTRVLSKIFLTTTLVLVECYSLWHESFTIFSSGFPFCHSLFSSSQSSA